MPTATEWRATLRLPGGRLECTIRRSTRARNLRLTIDPRHTAVVTVPSRAARSKGDAERIAEKFVADREPWLRHHLAEQDRQHERAAAMGPVADGGMILYRGEPHRLRVVARSPAVTGAGAVAGAGAASKAVAGSAPLADSASRTAAAYLAVAAPTLWATTAAVPATQARAAATHRAPARTTVSREGADDGDELVIRIGRTERRELPAILEAWLRVHARDAIEREIERHASAMGVAPAAVTVRDARTRWGSCSRARRLSFSWRLVMAPPEALETVVVHELAHLRVFGHGPDFWSIVASRRPDHRHWRRWLKEHRVELHAALG
jgi:predicted metal-dependent hydrolase